MTAQVTSDAEGKFSTTGLLPGKAVVTLPSSGTNDIMYPAWDVVQQAPVMLPSKEPLRVVLHHLQMRSLTGRVVDSKGKPLADVSLVYYARKAQEKYGIQDSFSASTDEHGDYRIDNIRPDFVLTMQYVQKDGYKLQNRAEVTEENGQLHASDIVLTAYDGVLAGTVTDAAGKPVAGAVVLSLEGGERAKTDAAGAFTLQGLPEGNNDVLAVTPEMAGMWQGDTDNRQVSIAMKPVRRAAPHDAALFKELWTSWQGLDNNQRGRILTIWTKTIYRSSPMRVFRRYEYCNDVYQLA